MERDPKPMVEVMKVRTVLMVKAVEEGLCSRTIMTVMIDRKEVLVVLLQL